MNKVIVTAIPSNGYCRLGRRWPQTETTVKVSDADLEILQTTPELIVKVVKSTDVKAPPVVTKPPVVTEPDVVTQPPVVTDSTDDTNPQDDIQTSTKKSKKK